MTKKRVALLVCGAGVAYQLKQLNDEIKYAEAQGWQGNVVHVDFQKHARIPTSTSKEDTNMVHVTPQQEAIYDIIKEHGPMSDQVLVPTVQHLCTYRSSSGIRTRRAELADKKMVYADGSITLPSGRSATVWTAR